MKQTSKSDLNVIWNFTSEEVRYLEENIQIELNSPDFKRPSNHNEEEHFENGHYLHSSQYFFAKKYFQSSNNCDKLVILLAHKIKELKLIETTLIGFRSYTGLVLSKARSILAGSEYSIDYAIIEQKKENEFTWQFIPDFSKIKKNFVIVLPITCTCSTYIRLRKYLEGQILELKKEFNIRNSFFNTEWKVDDNFINVFLIQEESIKNLPKPILVDREKINKIIKQEKRSISITEDKLSQLYSDYNWDRIDYKAIYFKKFPRSRPKNIKSNYIGHPLITLYSKLYLPESCPLCFPKSGLLTDEKNIFLTHNNFETPNLLLGFPNFGIKGMQSNPRKKSKVLSDKFLFNHLFVSSETLGSSHLYGHIRISKTSFLHYIRGNTFYQNNRENILSFFNDEFERIIINKNKDYMIQDIVFITPESKHNSTFLEELATNRALTLKNEKGDFLLKVHILRFDSNNEFIDNFMTNYKGLILDCNSILTIYFEEVISAGRTFKIISNYLKHYKYQGNTERQNRHGFDYIFTLIDRTPFYTREEIIKKLYSTKNKKAELNFIPYFKLNVPIVEAAHLGNPLVENVEHLKKMFFESHLDVLKAKIGSEIHSRNATDLPEENILFNKFTSLKHFPFEDENEEITIELFEVYNAILINGKLDLLKLYVAHQINSILSNHYEDITQFNNLLDSQKKGNLISYLIDEIWNRILKEGEMFFTTETQHKKRKFDIEREIVHDTLIKILSRHPFTYYKNI